MSAIKFYLITIFIIMLLLYILLPKVESSIAPIIPHLLINGDAKENIASIRYTVKNPFTTPNIKPPDLLNIFIIGKLAIISAANLMNNKKNLDTINSSNIVPILIINSARCIET